MLCSKCHQKIATVKIIQILNGEKTFKYYCEDCALKSELEAPVSLQDFFKGMLDMSMNNNLKPSTTTKKTSAIKQPFKCPQCGINYEQFRKIGKVGCSNCYKVFKRQLEAILKSVHVGSVHTGKVPQKLGNSLLIEREIDTLRKQIAKAIEDEDYEKAAVIRDKIRDLTKKSKG